MSKIRILLAAIILLIATGYFTTRFVNVSDEKNKPEEMQAGQKQEGEERPKQPLRVTEVSPLDEQFVVYFCTNSELRWRTLTNQGQPDSNPEILLSYQIQTRSGRYLHGTDLGFDGNIVRAKYQKQNDESSSCYQFQLSPILMRVPYLRHQTGKIGVSGLNMSELEIKERNDFYNSIKAAQISFLNRATKEVVLSFTTAPAVIEAKPTP